jgi:hypothetical protein
MQSFPYDAVERDIDPMRAPFIVMLASPLAPDKI